MLLSDLGIRVEKSGGGDGRNSKVNSVCEFKNVKGEVIGMGFFMSEDNACRKYRGYRIYRDARDDGKWLKNSLVLKAGEEIVSYEVGYLGGDFEFENLKKEIIERRGEKKEVKK